MQLYVNIDVDDLEKGIAFYTGGLGLQLSRRLFDGRVAELSGASSPIQLLQQARDYARHWTPVHLDFCVDDLDAALQRVLAAGAVLEGEVREHAWGRIATVGDPFGHGLCLLQLAPGGYANVA